LYQAEEGRIRIESCLQNETVWLSQDQMAALFDKAKSTLNELSRISLLKASL